eukprot:1161238-Pelagomonas_calceolata.AAC.5
MLYADDLYLTSNLPDQLQLMLDRLQTYAQQEGLVINDAKSEIFHCNSRGDNVPVFTLGGAPLACEDSCRYLGMLRIRQFASEHHLTNRLHTMLWLTKAYALPASMYACQIWGTIFIKEGAEMDCPLQTVHLCLLKRVLGVKRATPNCNSTTFSKVLQTDVEMSSLSHKCWTSAFLAGCMGLDRYNSFTHCVRSGQPIV